MSRLILWGGCSYASVLALLALLPLAPLVWCLGFFLGVIWLGITLCLKKAWFLPGGRVHQALLPAQTLSLGALLGLLCALWAGLGAGQALLLESQMNKAPLTWLDLKIQSDPKRVDQTLIFQAQVVSQSSDLSAKVLKIYWSLDEFSTDEYPEFGSLWTLPLVLKKPRGLANPGVLSKESKALASGISAEASVETNACLEQAVVERTVLEKTVDRALIKPLVCDEIQSPQGIYAVRSHLVKQFKTYFDQGPARAFTLALILGYQSELGPYRPVLNRLGLSHLFAVSGMHISMVALLGMGFGLLIWRFCFARLWSWFHWPGHRMPKALTIALLFGWVFALSYAALTGFALPAQRAMIALSVCGIGRYCFGQNFWLESFAVSLGLVLLMAPYAPLGLSFWFSFLAIGLLLLAFDQVQRPRQDHPLAWVKPILLSQCLMSFGLLPLSLLMGDDLQIFTPLVNLIAIPLVQICFLPLLMLLTMAFTAFDLLPEPLVMGLVGLVQDGFELAYLLLEMISQMQGASLLGLVGWFADDRPKFALSFVQSLVFLCGVVLLVMPSLKRLKWIALPGLLLMASVDWFKIPMGEYSIKQFDVGQGSGLLIETQNHRVLYDLGPKAYKGLSATEHIILPYFRFHGISHIDQLILSHEDQASLGHQAAFQESIQLGRVLKSQEGVDKDLNATPCYGQRWNYDGVLFELLDALPEQLTQVNGAYLTSSQLSNHRNNQSCLLKVSNAKQSALILGDLENNGINHLLQQARTSNQVQQFLKADLLLVPFHGSLKSSATGLLNQVKPRVAFVSAGYQHPFGHPHDQVVKRYQLRHIQLFNTADQGFLEWNSYKAMHQGYRGVRDQQRLW